MSMKYSFDFLSHHRDADSAPRSPDRPFRVLFLADLSGRENRGIAEGIAGRRIHAVESSGIDELMDTLQPKLGLFAGTERADGIAFGEFEHFHADQLCRRITGIGELLVLRKKLRDPARANEAMTAIRAMTESLPAAEVTPKDAGSAPAEAATGFESLLSGNLGDTPKGRSDVDALIKGLVGPHIIPETTPDQAAMIATVERAIASHLRDVLREPGVARLEAAWASLHLLITSLELDEDLRVSVMDISGFELEHDLAGEDPSASGLYEAIVRGPAQRAGGEPFTLVVTDRSFQATADDAQLAAKLGAIVRAGGAHLVISGEAGIIGGDSFAGSPDVARWTPGDDDGARAWAELRASDLAGSLSVVMPRFLYRTLYGSGMDELDTLDFEEIVGGSTARPYANSGVLAAIALGRAFQARGWAGLSMGGLGSAADIDGLPFVVRRVDGDSIAEPIAECWLTEPASSAMSSMGVVPVVSIQHRDAVRVGPIVSFAGKTIGLEHA